MAVNDERFELEGLQQLDPQVISIVYDRYFPSVFRYVRYRLGDESLAEDISSDVFVRLLEALRRRRGPKSNIKGWLLGTASHIITDHLRKSYRRPTEDLPESLADATPGISDQYLEIEQASVLRDALSQLTSDQQHVMALRFGEGFSLEETAKIMGKKVNAIKQLQFRALAALNRQVEVVK